MSKKKGLSVDEKRSRMLDFFYEKKDFYQLKELERMCQKEKGITSMSVKEILTSLVDDGLVDTDKVGTSVYFWAFPGKARLKRKTRLEEMESQKAEHQAKKVKLLEMIDQQSAGKERSSERDQLLTLYESLNRDKEGLLAELQTYKENDPEVIEVARQETKVAHEAANRWTENIFSVKSWIRNKFGFNEATIDKQFSLPEDLDYI